MRAFQLVRGPWSCWDRAALNAGYVGMLDACRSCLSAWRIPHAYVTCLSPGGLKLPQLLASMLSQLQGDKRKRGHGYQATHSADNFNELAMELASEHCLCSPKQPIGCMTQLTISSDTSHLAQLTISSDTAWPDSKDGLTVVDLTVKALIMTHRCRGIAT